MGDDHVRFLLKLPGKNATLCTSTMNIYACMCECLVPVEDHPQGVIAGGPLRTIGKDTRHL